MDDNLEEMSGERLLKMAARGNLSAFGVLYKKYIKPVRDTIRRISGRRLCKEDIDDLSHDLFENLLKHAKEKGNIIAINNFDGYINTIARNITFRKLGIIGNEPDIVSINHYSDEDNSMEIQLPIPSTSEEEIIAEEATERLRKAVFSLPPALYRIFRWHWLGKKNIEIGYELGEWKFNIELKSKDSGGRNISKDLRNDFKNAGFSLSENITISVKDICDESMIIVRETDGEKRIFFIKQEGHIIGVHQGKRPEQIAPRITKARKKIWNSLLSYGVDLPIDVQAMILKVLRDDIEFLEELLGMEDNREYRRSLRLLKKKGDVK